MRVCSGRWRVAFGLGAALAVVGGSTPAARAAEKGRPTFPWRKPPAATAIPQAAPRGTAVVLPESLTLEEESPLTSVAQATPQQPPASSTGQVPSPPPPLNRAAPTTPVPTGPIAPPASSTGTPAPAPAQIGEVLGGPVPVEGLHGDPYPVYYRDRPRGNKAEKAEIISRNRSGEPAWYREWRIRYYGYYPTQWRPFPEGWHLGRNLPPAPYAHPYDLKQPDPDPEAVAKRPTPPRSLRDREAGRDENRPPAGTDRRDPAPALRATPGAGTVPVPVPGANTPGTLTPNPDRSRRTFP